MGKKKTSNGFAQTSFKTAVNDTASKLLINEAMPQLDILAKSQLEVTEAIKVQAELIASALTQIKAVANVLCAYQGITPETIEDEIYKVEDSLENLTRVESIEAGDTVRLAISFKSEQEDDFDVERKLKIRNIGQGQSLKLELEQQLLGKKVGQTELKFGEYQVRVKIVTISRSL